ncbi:DUF4974 domain-containing protein [Hymenobacter gummosus]|uniref:DUF4974 domain-containing protein n=1 Tax=Hymenobacter gummosus TaxID=1776032 RepID=A0A3S0JKL7_9BACT|nr:secretin and TonB N-terminal domain-containing protein [Hymenobacter gummosus]RTQ53469.1 DUF4974 domain-containing protein [Hymenobacter gummosus]
MRNRICLAAAVLCALAGEPAAAQGRTSSVLDCRVTVVFNQAPLESVLRTLKRQYGIRISYSNTALNLRQPVTLNAQNQPLRQVLGEVLEGKNIGYELVGDQLVLHPAPPKAAPAAKPAPAAAPAATTTTVSKAVIDKAPDAAPAAAATPAPRPAAPAETTRPAAPEKTPVRPKTDKAPAQKTSAKPASSAPAASAKGRTATGGKAPGASSAPAGKATKAAKPAGKAGQAAESAPEPAVKVPDNTPANDPGATASAAPAPGPDAATQTPPAAATPPPAAPADSVASAAAPAVEPPAEEPARAYTKAAQISFLGPLGSNGLRSGQTVNHVSINVLGGYAAGVEGFEAAGLFNVDRDTVAGVQLAGLANVVGRNLDGFQAAGLANVLGGSGTGWQAAGLLNVATRPVAGAQTAGLFNFVGPRKRTAVLTASVDPASGAETTRYEAGPEQAGGKPAVQAAGLFNVSLASMRGGQVAGLFNVTKETRGVQAAGLFNVAGTVRGVQVAGLVNFADSVQGVSLAPFNFVVHGYHRLELTHSETWPVTASLKLGGSAAFYTFLTAAYDGFGSGPRRWAAGYGAGTDMWSRRRLSLSLDLATMQVNEEQRGLTKELNLHNQLRLLLGLTPFKPSSHIRLVAGPTVSLLVTRRFDTTEGRVYSNLSQGRKLWLDEGNATTKVLGWYGYSVGLRF